MEKNLQIDLIKRLSDVEGISGFEDKALDIIEDELKDSYKIERDRMKNLYINNIEKEKRTKPVVMIEAHSDEVGFMVQSIEANGLLKFITVGGWSSEQVQAHRVKVLNNEGQYIEGIISSIPPHFSKGDRSKSTSISEMFIDVGTSSYEETVNIYKISIGAPVVPSVISTYNETSKLFLGKAFDDRIGCASIVEVMKDIEKEQENLNVIVTGAISAQEEVGTRGAVITSQRVSPSVAIVLEGPPADDSFRGKYTSQCTMRKGVQIRHMDPTMIANPKLVKFVKDIANKNNIPYQEAVRESGGTNAGKIHLENFGIPTIVLGVPVRYTHSHHNYISMDDYEAMVKLLYCLLKELNAEVINNL